MMDTVNTRSAFIGTMVRIMFIDMVLIIVMMLLSWYIPDD